MKRSLVRSSLVVSLLTVVGSAAAQPGVHDGFDYPDGSSLLGQTGGSGFSTPWESAGYGGWTGACTGMPHLRVWQLMQGQNGSTRSSSGGAQRSFSSPIPGTPGTSVWVSFLARQTGPTSASWLGIKLPSSGPGSDPFLFLGKPFGQANWGCDNGRSGGIRSSTDAAVGEVRLVARIDFHAGADDVTLWVNPALASPPDASTAALSLPAYGNFADLRKVLIETGSITGTVSNVIDELSIGSSYQDVTPIAPGVVLDGFTFTPKPGSTVVVDASTGAGAAPRVRGTRNPGTPDCGVEVALDTANGGGIAVGSEVYATAGGEIKIKHKGWDGLIYHRASMRRSSDGYFDYECDLSGTPTAAIRTVVRGSNGTVVLDETTPGPIGFVSNVPGGMVSGLCPDGGQPRWHNHLFLYDPPIYKNGNFIWFEDVWYFGCPGPIIISGRSTITTYGVCDAGTMFSPGVSSLEVSSPDLPLLDLSGPSMMIEDATLSAAGDMLLSTVCGGEQCDDGTPCDDPDDRRVRATGIGSSGQDGVDITWPRGASASSGEFTLGDLHLGAGRATAVRRGIGSDGVERDLETFHFEGDNDRTIIRPDFSAIGATGYTVTGFDATGAVVYQETLGNGDPVFHKICGPNQVPVWGWITMWVWNPWPTNGSYQTHWGVKGCMTIGSGGGANDPTYSTERVIFTPVNPAIEPDPTGVSLRARGISDLTVFNVETASADITCPADFNNDGFVDFFDYDDFVLAYETGTPNADVNGDGFIDFFDYDDYVLAYEVGC
jgi:hypothetical protein